MTHQRWLEHPYETWAAGEDYLPANAVINTGLHCPGCRWPLTFESGEWNCDKGGGSADWSTGNPRFTELAQYLVAEWFVARDEAERERAMDLKYDGRL